jgi:hypothetical protein
MKFTIIAISFFVACVTAAPADMPKLQVRQGCAGPEETDAEGNIFVRCPPVLNI